MRVTIGVYDLSRLNIRLVFSGKNMSFLSDPNVQEYMYKAAGVLFLIYSGLCFVAKSTWSSNSVDYYALPLGGNVPIWFRFISWLVIALGVGLFFTIVKNI